MKKSFRSHRYWKRGIFCAALMIVGQTHAHQGEWIVRLDQGADSVLNQILSKGFHLQRVLDASRGLYVVKAKDSMGQFYARSFSNMKGVRYIEPNYRYQTQVSARSEALPTDPSFKDQWALQNIGQKDARGQEGLAGADVSAVKAWQVTQGSSKVVAAVVDTGIDYNHPDLQSNMWTRPGSKSEHGVNLISDMWWNRTRPMDDNGHGSHCAGIIGAAGNNSAGITGVNWKVGLMAVKSLDKDGSGYTDTLAAGIRYAVENGARVINASWGGGGFSQTLFDAIRDAEQHGVLFVAAAGNGGIDQVGDNNDDEPTYPASYDLSNVISVAASDNRDELAEFSNFGARSVFIVAPGRSILSTIPKKKYAVYSGTSMAAPHVTGAAALLLSVNPNMSIAELKDALLKSVDMVPAAQGKVLSNGRLSLSKLLGL